MDEYRGLDKLPLKFSYADILQPSILAYPNFIDPSGCLRQKLNLKLKKKPVHRSHEETLMPGQFVGACMGGVPPQDIVS